MKKKGAELSPRVDVRARSLRPVAHAAWPFGVAGFAAGAAVLGAAAASGVDDAPPCAADQDSASFADRFERGWAELARRAHPTPMRTAGALPPMPVSEPAPSAVATTTPAEPEAMQHKTAGVARAVPPLEGAHEVEDLLAPPDATVRSKPHVKPAPKPGRPSDPR